MRKKTNLIWLILFCMPVLMFGQHRGDNLSFQGTLPQNDIGVRAAAMGGAYTAQFGDLNSLFYNPAGLAEVGNLQISIAANSSSALWRENQNYRPNRMFWTLSFYLEGLYVPDPANNGIWDYNLAQDSSYIVQLPKTGLDPFSEEAADWQRKKKELVLNNFAIAYPLDISGNKIVISAAYSRVPVLDFDRNDTYLDPHIGYDEYGIVQRVVSDTVRFSWSRFTRQREGAQHHVTAGLGINLSEKIKLGVSMNYQSSKTDDFLSLNRVGYFDIAKDNRFRFSYDTLDVSINGDSKFTALHFNIGGLLKMERLAIGLNITLPYAMTRKWNYQTTTFDSSGTVTVNSAGEDKFSLPATLSVGASFTPADRFTIALDYSFAKYSDAAFELGQADSLHRNWVDGTELRCGLEYRAFEFLSLQAGYRYQTETFVPDGAAIKDRGPAATSYTLGARLKSCHGWLNLAYKIRQLKYYDSYYSNTNYVYQSFDNLMASYTFVF